MSKSDPQKAYRFIPYRKQDIVSMCLQDNRLSAQEDDFKRMSQMLGSIFHFEFHHILEAIKEAYAHTDPDSDTRQPGTTEQPESGNFVNLLDGLLEKANYERVTQADLNRALAESSLFKIRLHVDFEDFSDVLLFSRGESIKKETVKSWFGLRSTSIEFSNFERVVIYIRLRDDYAQAGSAAPGCKPGATLLKLFRNVPKADLEMLFPNTQVRMRLVDKLLIGIPALVSGGVVLTTKLGASLLLLGSLFGFWFGWRSQPAELNQASILALLAGAGALGGYLWKQFSNFKNRKLRFMQSLTQNLYFKNLDNNAGVFHRIVNDAEEEECKEAILAYYFLLISERPLSRLELDNCIEAWFASKWQCTIDFEIDDALQKLLTLGLIDEAQGKLGALPLSEAIRKLNRRWDDYFIVDSINAN